MSAFDGYFAANINGKLEISNNDLDLFWARDVTWRTNVIEDLRLYDADGKRCAPAFLPKEVERGNVEYKVNGSLNP
jgi:hypothetical protein